MTNCSQPLTNGQPCSAPAVRGSSFCRHHDQRRPRMEAEEESRENEPLMLPPLVDKPSMLAALNQVVQALAAGRIKRSVATTLLSGIKLANRLLTEIAEAGEAASPISSHLQFANAEPAARSQTSSRTGSSPAQTVVRLAASDNPQKPAAIFNSDRFVEEMMAQAHDLLAGQPRPDPKFLRV